jgi:hypothetical protein
VVDDGGAPPGAGAVSAAGGTVLSGDLLPVAISEALGPAWNSDRRAGDPTGGAGSSMLP